MDTLEEGLCTVTTFCNLSEAFDCISHSILLSKYYDIRRNVNDFTHSFLTNRSQYVYFNDKPLPVKRVEPEVP